MLRSHSCPGPSPLADELTLKDGRTLRTLHNARDVFASGVFSAVKHSPPLEHAIDLLIDAESGNDIKAATDQVAIALRAHGMMT
jgi:hypothetical protein